MKYIYIYKVVSEELTSHDLYIKMHCIVKKDVVNYVNCIAVNCILLSGHKRIITMTPVFIF